MARLLLILCLIAAPVFAVQPDEVLSDPVLEERARALSDDLRCLVCRNENIDESNADLARDLRILVRERLVAGDSDEQVMDFVVNRYGEYVLLRPTMTGSNMILWVSGPIMLLFALIIAFVYLRGRQTETSEASLNEDEKKRLAELLKD
ncbi:cytochrome c-type biogenesis protein [Parasulfitobacter algicola]|uniref:Cytochrome c-type biogenesis protein n=1 Tax=Parasulfitobacter algicola TaxID=2614809 RepID=A0ABX2ISQ9_9RHOB|nr:cytochrome c-type biogenesis protein [Sulfitobacter algicola]NSX55590.1 cytochrome c-type biogenesis protein CcmH [Sulfitobacter algicola]